jgi:hypothetical protein
MATSGINPLQASSQLQALDAMLKSQGNFNPQLAMIMLGSLQMGEEQKKSQQLMQEAMANLKAQTAANQLSEQIATLKAARAAQNPAKDTDTPQVTTPTSSERAVFVDNMQKAGVPLDSATAQRLKDGKFTAADLDAATAKVKTLQDQASNAAQLSNMYIQNSNNRQNQITSFIMAAIDLMKSMGDRVLR